MEHVEPIRDKKKIETMKKLLKAKNVRDYALFTLGINSGLRISDILELKISDVVDQNCKIKDRIIIKEKKTKKRKSFPIGNGTKKALNEYLATRTDIDPDHPLFVSRKRDADGNPGHLQRAQAYRVINGVAKEIGLATDTYKIGTHTLRKTFGYHAYKSGVDLSMIQDILNHSTPSITLRYIGITQEEKDQVYINLDL